MRIARCANEMRAFGDGEKDPRARVVYPTGKAAICRESCIYPRQVHIYQHPTLTAGAVVKPKDCSGVGCPVWLFGVL